MIRSENWRRTIALTLIVSLTVALCWAVVFGSQMLMGIIASIGFIGMLVLDLLLGGALYPHNPSVMWLISGAFIGLCLGSWMIGPAFNLRRRRWIALVLPGVMMLIFVILGLWRQL